MLSTVSEQQPCLHTVHKMYALNPFYSIYKSDAVVLSLMLVGNITDFYSDTNNN